MILNWMAPTENEVIGGELLKTPTTAPASRKAATHELQFDPVEGLNRLNEPKGAAEPR